MSDDGLLRNGSGPNVLEHMFPISVLRIEPGVVWGTDRVVTSASGTFGFAAIGDSGEALPELYDSRESSVMVALYYQGLLVRNDTLARTSVAHVSMVNGSVDMAVLVHHTVHVQARQN